MSARTKEEISEEIAALRALKPVGVFARKTAGSIQLSIDALNGCIDETSDEFTVELTEAQQDIAITALAWMRGESDVRPSDDWGELVAS